ncbi:MAG: phosphoribosyl-ATP diphosphatase [archaeon]
MSGLVPTIIQEKNGTVLALFYSNKESLKKSIRKKEVWLYSRTRKKVCKKGATSGNTQRIINIQSDCDADALLFTVKQESKNNSVGKACHTGAYSCFWGERKFDSLALYEKIVQRKKSAKTGAYTKTLFENKTLLSRKLLEEAAEVVLSKNKKELIWEAADLMYFLFVTMAKNGVTLADVENENARRNAKNESMETNKEVRK